MNASPMNQRKVYPTVHSPAASEASRGLLTPLGYECAFVAYARLGRHEEALQVCRKACMAVPRSAGFFHRRAARLLLDDRGDDGEAEHGEHREARRHGERPDHR